MPSCRDRATLKAPGLPSGERTAEFLWDLHIAAIGADNPGVEVWPQGTGQDAEQVADVKANHPDRMHEVFAHSMLLPMLGIPLGEMFDLSGLADGLRGRRSVRLPVRLGAAQHPAWRRHPAQRAGDQVAPPTCSHHCRSRTSKPSSRHEMRCIASPSTCWRRLVISTTERSG